MTCAPRPAVVLLVGHCAFDAGMIGRAVQSALPDAVVEPVDSERELALKLPGAGLLLVNRVLDGAFREASGVELIRSLQAAEAAAPAAMLISNYPDAQADAVEAGALPGFGKSALFDEETRRRLREAMAARA